MELFNYLIVVGISCYFMWWIFSYILSVLVNKGKVFLNWYWTRNDKDDNSCAQSAVKDEDEDLVAVADQESEDEGGKVAVQSENEGEDLDADQSEDEHEGNKITAEEEQKQAEIVTVESVEDKSEVNFMNFFRLHSLLYNNAPNLLRNVFRDLWTKTEGFKGSEWDNTPTSAQAFIEGIGEKLFKSTKRIQKELLKSGNVSRWDLTFLTEAIKCFSEEDFRKVLPKCNMRSELDKLVAVRNLVAHSGTMECTQDEFTKQWTQVENALLALGMSPNEIQTAKTMTFSADNTVNTETNDDNAGDLILKEFEKIKTVGNNLFKSGRYLKAFYCYTDGLNLPGLPNAELAILYSNRSAAALKMDEYEQAKDDAKSSITLKPGWFRGYNRLASVYDVLKEYKLAVENARLAYRYNPDSMELREHLDFLKSADFKQQREEHLDPMKFEKPPEGLWSPSPQNIKELKDILGNRYPSGLQICAEAHKYYHGTQGYKRDFEMAATLFGQAANEGNAEGMYNLAIMMSDGIGVKPNMNHSLMLLLQAANQPRMTKLLGVADFPNIGVTEAQHALGMRYEEGISVMKDCKQAKEWYDKALESGQNGVSANNLACMYGRGEFGYPDLKTAVLYWELSMYRGIVRAMENLIWEFDKIAFLYPHGSALFPIKSIQQIWMYAVHCGSIVMKPRQKDFKITDQMIKDFDPSAFKAQLREKLWKSSLQHLVIDNPYDVSMSKVDHYMSINDNNGKEFYIMNHRILLQDFMTVGRTAVLEAGTAKLITPRSVDIIGLQEIFYDEMDFKINDKIYDKQVLKVNVMEDPILRNSSYQLLVEDGRHNVFRIFIYNYPKTKKEILLNEIGYGCRFIVIYPYLRRTTDRLFAIRIDDPNLIIKQPALTDKTRCRFCGESKSSIPCRLCKRVFYCSKLCMMKDLKELNHKLICFKKL